MLRRPKATKEAVKELGKDIEGGGCVGSPKRRNKRCPDCLQAKRDGKELPYLENAGRERHLEQGGLVRMHSLNSAPSLGGVIFPTKSKSPVDHYCDHCCSPRVMAYFGSVARCDIVKK